MTLAVGWINAGTAFVVADSIVSRLQEDQLLEETSMGEAPHPEMETNEAAVKVYQLAPTAIGSFAGISVDGISTFHRLRNRLRMGARLEDELGAVESPAEVVVANIHGTAASLYVRRAGQWRETYTDSAVEVLGSAIPQHAALVEGAVKDLISGEGIRHDADHVLVNVIAHLRGQLVRASQRSRGIGGAFYGMRVDSRGVTRHPDILFMMVDRTRLPDFFPVRSTLVGWRGELAFSMAAAPDSAGKIGRHVRFHASDVNPVTVEFATDTLRDLETKPLRPAYVALIDAATGAPVVLRQNPFVEQHFAGIDFVEDSILIRVTGHLMNILERLPTLEQMLAAKMCPHHFIAAESDAQRLIRAGWFAPHASRPA